ncbi:flagellin [Pelagibacterium sp.]|uniref:flagellin N-terminal helical domain-containing protein n=1 Tax=Pelagibacterium sp. TaxID=1967288 RepID=UPI003BA8D03D
MSDITLSKAVRSNLLSLQNTADMMATTQNRLATGKKVNSALDNPTNFFTASSLNSRAGDMNQLLDGMANGIQTLEAADNGLKAITKTLESMQSTLRQARQDKTFQTSSYTLDADTVTGGATGQRELSFTGGALGTESISLDLTTDKAGSVTGGADYTAPAAAAGAAAVTASADFAAVDASTPLTFDVQGNNDAAAITVTIDGASAADDTAMTIDEVIADINDELIAGGSTIRAQANADTGRLELVDTDAANVGAAASITVTASAGTATLNLTADATTDAESTGTDAEEISFTINDIDITLNGDDHADAASAAAAIQTQLTAGGAAAGVTATAEGERIVITGPTDGTGIELAGADVDDVFGAEASRTVDQWGEAGSSDGTAKTVDELVNEINNNDELSFAVRASNDNGKLRLENLSTQELDIGGVSSTGEVDGTSSSGTSSIGGNEVRAGLADQFRELRDQLDKLVDDASFNGVNLLRGDNLQITFNETGTSELNIQTNIDGEAGASVNSTTLGIETNLQAEDLDSDASIDGFMADVKSAINTVRSQASSFGSSLSIVENRQDFSKNMINTLETGASNLTLADANEEAANLLALQTRQQLSSTALSMASQQDQSVLRLF